MLHIRSTFGSRGTALLASFAFTVGALYAAAPAWANCNSGDLARDHLLSSGNCQATATGGNSTAVGTLRTLQAPAAPRWGGRPMPQASRQRQSVQGPKPCHKPVLPLECQLSLEARLQRLLAHWPARSFNCRCNDRRRQCRFRGRGRLLYSGGCWNTC